MSARVEFPNEVVAELSDAGVWSRASGPKEPTFMLLLNRCFGSLGDFEPGEYVPNLVAAAAETAAVALGGEVLEIEESPALPKDVIL